ncbi:hypothetical protein HC928_00490 [bacterium]|nr:hypothetical protein [bacterium]
MTNFEWLRRRIYASAGISEVPPTGKTPEEHLAYLQYREFFKDAANYCFLIARYDNHPNKHFEATDREE